MKIIRLTTFLDFGGVEKRLSNVASVVDKNEWVFCAINKGGQAEKEILAKGKRVRCFNLPYKIPNVNTLSKIYKFFKKEKPDVVHTSGAEANFYGVLAARIAGVPKIIAEEIGTPNHSAKGKLLFKFVYKFADYVVGNSTPVVVYLNKNNGVPEKKLKLIPNPVLFKNLPTKSYSNDVFTIVSVSRLEKIKNIEGIFAAIKRLKEEGLKIKYTIVGSGGFENQLKELATGLHLNDVVHFLGFKKDPYPQLLKADLYIINSYTEGFSNSLVEAMYSGTPSISTISGSAPEIIKEGKNGWLVPVDDVDALSKKIKHIIMMNKVERVKIGLNGKNYVEDNFSLENHLSKLMKMYR